MAVGSKTLVTLLALSGVMLSIPAIAYWVGLLKIEGRPLPADPRSYTPAELSAAWQRCYDRLPVAVVPLNPWGFTADFLWGDGQFHGVGQYAAMQVTRAYNYKHLSGGMALVAPFRDCAYDLDYPQLDRGADSRDARAR